jgi:hypothetical protein
MSSANMNNSFEMAATIGDCFENKIIKITSILVKL